MAFHTVAWTASLGNVTDAQVSAITDDVEEILGGDFRFRVGRSLMALWLGMPVVGIRARFDAAPFRRIGRPQIIPFDPSSTPSNDPNHVPMFDAPMRFPARTTLQLQASTSAAGPTRINGIGFLDVSYEPEPTGDIWWVRATSTTAASAAFLWTTVVFTLDLGLDPGEYQLNGSDLQSTNGVAHRWIFPGKQERPGSLSKTVLGNRGPWWAYLRGRPGSFGKFRDDALPLLQVLTNGVADASHDIYMGLTQTLAEFSGQPAQINPNPTSYSIGMSQ
jgi:hypothetical protein